MSTQTRRTRLKAVYLTDSERDLVITALHALTDGIKGESGGQSYWEVKFSKSYTAKRLAETAALFEDKNLREQP